MLSNKETFFATILSKLQSDIAILDKNGKYVFVNNYAVSDPVIREWIIGKTDMEYCLFRGLDVSIAHTRRDKFKEALEKKTVVEWEELMYDKEGVRRVFLRRFSPVFNDGNVEITYLIGYGLEITENRKIRDELEANKRFMDAILNNSPHLIYVKDATGRFLMANKATAGIFNASVDEVINKNNAEVHQNLLEVNKYAETDHKVIKEGKLIRLEEPFTRSDGSVTWFDTIKVPIVESNGTVNVLGISSDITARKLNEQLLQAREKQLIEAQRLTRSGNWIRHLEDDRVEWSAGMYLIWERESELGPPSLEEIMNSVSKEDQELIYSNIDTVIEKSLEREFIYSISIPSGVKILKTLAKAVKNEDGKVVAVFGSVIDITEQVHTENRLLLNEQRLNEAQDMAKMGSFEYHPISGEIKWSKGMYSVFELEETLTPSLDLFNKYLHPDDKDWVNAKIKSLPKDVTSWLIDYRIVTPFGKIKYLEVLSKVAEKTDGNLSLIVGSCIDVTERKMTEERLRLNEQRLFEVQELSHSGSWEVSFYPEISMEWSPGIFKIWDMDPESDIFPPEEFYQRVHEDDRQRVISAYTELRESGQTLDVQYRVITRLNNEKVFWSRGRAVKDNSGKVVKIYGTNTDVTDRQLTEQRLRQNEQELIRAQEIAKLGSWNMDFKTRKLEWSVGMYHIWERDLNLPPPLIEEVRAAIFEDDREKFDEAIMLTISTNREQTVEFRIVLPDGSARFVEGRTRVVKDANNNPLKIFGTLININDRKLVEEELIRARVLAEESSKAKEYFLASISHELRTPLNGILGMSRLLQKTALSSIQREYTDVLQQTGENLLVIINDILDFAKIEAGKMTLEEINFNPTRVADTAINLQMFKAEEKDVYLKHIHEGDTPLPDVAGDPYRLNQILLNLLTNAIKFTNSGEVILSHRIMEEDDEYVKILFSIKDTGIGIPIHLQGKIFDSFTQVNEGSSRHGGLGLGLTITKSLVERQGGNIWVESEPDKGSNFQFYIPYRKAVVKSSIEKEKQIDLMPLGVLHVLLVEDNKVNLFITEAMLRDWGFKVDVALNGEEALELIRSNLYDLILMDIQMPVMNGLEATKQIRQLPDTRKAAIPIIALTANTGKQAHKQFLTEGMNDWVIKPFNEETLFKKIARHVVGKNWLSQKMRKRKFPTRKKPVYEVQPLYDLSMLRKDAPDNVVFIRKMLTIFIESIPPIVDKMEEHFDNAEMDTVSTLAHKIKPTIDSAGISSLKEVIRNIEGYREKRRTRVQLQDDLRLLKEIIHKVTEQFKLEIEKITD